MNQTVHPACHRWLVAELRRHDPALREAAVAAMRLQAAFQAELARSDPSAGSAHLAKAFAVAAEDFATAAAEAEREP